MTRLIAIVAPLALFVAASCGDSPPTSARGQSLPGHTLEHGWIAVDFEDGTTKAEYDLWESDWGIDLEFNSTVGEDSGITIGRYAGDVGTLLAQIRSHPSVEIAEPLYTYHALWQPDDPDFKYQWHMEKVRAPEAWDFARGKGVVVAVIDTGIAFADWKSFKEVEDLKGAEYVEGYDFVNDRKEAVDDHGHGTHVAGTIAQVTGNAVGVTGLANQAKLMPVKVLSAAGSGNSADIADAIRWSADHGAKVINMSLGGGGYSQMMANAVSYARKKGTVVVAAAGNASTGRVSYPAAYPGAVAVSATRFDDQLAPYSSWGKQLDIAAPGGDKNVDQNGDGKPDGVLQNTIARGDPAKSIYEFYQGTSMATPHVAAAAALVMSTGVTDPDDVERALFESARKVHGRTGWDEKYGHGVLDAAAAVGGAKQRTGIWRFLWMVLVAVILLIRKGKLPIPGAGKVVMLLTMALTGVGLFFLPWVVPGFAGMEVASAPLMDWGVHVFGAGAHANPLTWSALFCFGLSMLLFHKKALRPVLAGLAAGTAAFLFHALFSGHADVAYLPGRLLDGAWLLANGAAAFLLAWALTRREA